MGRKTNILIKLFSLTFALLIAVSAFTAYPVKAEGEPTVFSEGEYVPSAGLKALTLKTAEVETEIPQYVGSYKTIGENGILMNPGTVYTAKYPLDYFGKTLEVKIDVYLDANDHSNDNYDTDKTKYAKVYLDGDKLVTVGWNNVTDAIVHWNISVYEKTASGNVSYLKYLLFGYKDPDESNFSFSTSGRKLYYNPEESPAAKYFLVEDNGLYRKGDVIDFPDNYFYIGMKNEETFSFTTITAEEGALHIPYFYSKNYNVNYIMNDSTEHPAVNPATNPSTYITSPVDVITLSDPTRTGYKFLGWKERTSVDPIVEVDNKVIPVESVGDKTFVAYWKLDEYIVKYDPNWPAESPVDTRSTEMMPDDECEYFVTYDVQDHIYTVTGYRFLGWNTKADNTGTPFADTDTYINLIEEDGGVVTLYAQWQPYKYNVHYDANEPDGKTATPATMESDTNRVYNQDYTLKPNEFAIEGYEFLGWNTEPDRTGTDYNDEQGYRNLVETDGGEVTMYAKWNKIEYKILYDANGGSGTMDTQVFEYDAEKMISNPNQFTRDGYKFTYFTYIDDKGNLKICYSIDDFAELLKILPSRSITLKANWEAIPVHHEIDDDGNDRPHYTPPVTGIYRIYQ